MDYTELFDRYLDGRLDGKELEDFKKKLQEDSEFKKSLEGYILLQRAGEEAIGRSPAEDPGINVDRETDQMSLQDIDKYGVLKRTAPDENISEFNRKLLSVEKEFLKGEDSIIKRKLWQTLSIAATVIVAMVIAIFFIVKQNSVTNRDLFTEYYYPYAGSENVFEMGRSSDSFLFAVRLFESGDYARASILFEQYVDSSEFNGYASLYSGLTQMQMGKWEDALISLQRAVQSENNQMILVARWYLGLCYLRVDDAELARRQFEILASSKNEYTVRSRRILRKIQ